MDFSHKQTQRYKEPSFIQLCFSENGVPLNLCRSLASSCFIITFPSKTCLKLRYTPFLDTSIYQIHTQYVKVKPDIFLGWLHIVKMQCPIFRRTPIILSYCWLYIFHYMHIKLSHILLLTSPWCPASSVYRWMFHNITIQLLGYPLWLKNCSHWFHRTFQIFHCWSSRSSVASRPNSMDVRRWTQGAQEGGRLL